MSLGHIAFRNGRRNYEERPKRKGSAQIAWDFLSEKGQVALKGMRLHDGYWMAEREDSTICEVEAPFVYSLLRSERSSQ